MPLFTGNQSGHRNQCKMYARTSEVLGRQKDVPNVMLLNQGDNVVVDFSSVKAAHKDLTKLPICHHIQYEYGVRWPALSAMTDLAWSQRETSSPWMAMCSRAFFVQ